MGLTSSAALLADMNKKTLVKYTIGRSKLKKMFEKILPDYVDEDCCKYVLSDGRIVLRALFGRDATYIHTDNLELLNTYTGAYGCLRGTLPPDLLVYAKRTTANHRCEVHIYSVDNKHQRALILRPSEGRKWSELSLSICSHPSTGNLVIVGRFPNTLDIYNGKGGWYL